MEVWLTSEQYADTRTRGKHADTANDKKSNGTKSETTV
jgi:hypothetical protein